MTIKELKKATAISEEINMLTVEINKCKKLIDLIKNDVQIRDDIKFVSTIGFAFNSIVIDNELAIETVELMIERLQKKRELLIAEFRNL